jgi:hypothetical protein
LHKFTPPYSSAGAKVEGDKLIYPIPRIDDPDDFGRTLSSRAAM